ncbi:hypothetical protein Gotur_019951 [Gossypium turneri]
MAKKQLVGFGGSVPGEEAGGDVVEVEVEVDVVRVEMEVEVDVVRVEMEVEVEVVEVEVVGVEVEVDEAFGHHFIVAALRRQTEPPQLNNHGTLIVASPHRVMFPREQINEVTHTPEVAVGWIEVNISSLTSLSLQRSRLNIADLVFLYWQRSRSKTPTLPPQVAVRQVEITSLIPLKLQWSRLKIAMGQGEDGESYLPKVVGKQTEVTMEQTVDSGSYRVRPYLPDVATEDSKPYLPEVAVEQIKDSKSYFPEVAVEQIKSTVTDLVSLKLQ